MRVAFFVFLLIVFFSGCVQTYPRSGSSQIEWHGYEEGMQLAKAQNKPVFIFFYTDWCDYCKQMESKTFADPQVVEISRHFINIKLNAEREKALAEKFQYIGPPFEVFLEPGGKIIEDKDGAKAIFAGYYEPKDWIEIVNSVLKVYAQRG